MPDAIPLLRDVLNYARDRSDSVSGDIELFKQVSYVLGDRLQLRSTPAARCRRTARIIYLRLL